MTGVDIVGALLLADGDVTDLVPAARIKEGVLPDAISLPALLVTDVSSVERQELRRGATVRTTDRVAVTVRTDSIRSRAAILAAVKKCCAGMYGDIGGGSSVSILTDGRGPALNGPASTFEQTQDFKVSFDETA